MRTWTRKYPTSNIPYISQINSQIDDSLRNPKRKFEQEVHLSIEDKLNSALVAIPKQICKPVKKGFTAIGSLLNTLVGKAKAGYKEIREDWQEEYPARELSLEHNMQTNYASLLSTLLLYTGFR